MTQLRTFASQLSGLFRKRRLEVDLDDELLTHIEMLTEENIRRGMATKEARYAALCTFGGVARAKESYREQWSLPGVESLGRNVRTGLRQLRRSPGFAAVVVATLALGIGADTAIFSVVNAVLLKPLPFSKPDDLAIVFEANEKAGIPANGCSYAEFEEWRKQTHIFSEVAAFQQHELTLTGRGEPTTVRVGDLTPEAFAVLGARPMIGRMFLPEDGRPDAAPVAILSEFLWRDRFGADRAIVGSTITLDKRSFTVVGVMPSSFHFPIEGPARQLWIPLLQDPLLGPLVTRPGGHFLRVVARLNPGVSLAQAQAEMDILKAEVSLPQYRYSQPEQWAAFMNAVFPPHPGAAWAARYGCGGSDAADRRVRQFALPNCRCSSSAARKV